MSAIWVVGGTDGIGKATVERLRKDNIPVYVTGSEVDVAHPEQLEDYVKSAFGVRDVDGLVYSAGVNHLDWSHKIDPYEMLRLYQVNVVGLINVLQSLRVGKLSRVVVIGSDAAWRPMRTSVAYNASKAALHAAVQCIARERASEEFAINVVAPGVTEPTGMIETVEKHTEHCRGWTPRELRDYENIGHPLGRRANVDEIAEVICNVLFTKTPYLNGAVIPVNGAR